MQKCIRDFARALTTCLNIDLDLQVLFSKDRGIELMPEFGQFIASDLVADVTFRVETLGVEGYGSTQGSACRSATIKKNQGHGLLVR
jgi:hypothetical protein